MPTKITGNELRDRLLARMRQPAPEANEQLRIEVLASAVNRELLEIIATKEPRSINELVTLSGRLQPNVSRSLNALARAGLLTVTPDGRASVPRLTTEGERKARDLGFVAAVTPAAAIEAGPANAEPVFAANVIGPRNGDLENDVIDAEVTARLPGFGQYTITASLRLDLNELCENLFSHWWRLLFRRADPFRMFVMERAVGGGVSQATLLAEATGHKIELLARSLVEDEDIWRFPILLLDLAQFRSLVLDELVQPAVSYLRAGRRFDRPIEASLRRIEDIERYPAEFGFWRTAGALGLAEGAIDAALADDIARLIDLIADEDARLDFASGTNPAHVATTLDWATAEIRAKGETNRLPRLVELRKNGPAEAVHGGRPYRIGITRAERAREQLGLAADYAIGGMEGLARLFGGNGRFTASLAGEDPIRGFQAHGDSEPVVVVKGGWPRSTSFLVARAIGDYLVFGSREAPIADLYTDRQAVGRAFAAEFLAPARGVIHMIEEEQLSMVTVADHYGVDMEVVSRQYRNNPALHAQA